MIKAKRNLNVLVLQNEANEGLGIIQNELGRLGAEVKLIKVFDFEVVPTIINSSKYSHLIVLGGTKSVVDCGEPDKPDNEGRHAEGSLSEGSLSEGFLNDTISLIKDCFKKDVAVLGICLGAQMMARALGAKVYKGDVQEIGWFDVEVTKDGLEDNIFSVFKSEEVFFQWHGDTFELPVISNGEDVTHLATSELFKNQAFGFVTENGRRSYALQFHPEVDREMIDNWKSVITKDISEMSRVSKNNDFVDFKDLSNGDENNILSDVARSGEFFLRFLRG